jgi:hypothetical protein
MGPILFRLRLYFVLLAVFAVGRWLMGTSGVPYERGTAVFSLVLLTLLGSFFYAAFGRRLWGLRLPRAMALAVSLALATQAVIFLATLLSYALGIETSFNHPRALNVEAPLPLIQALDVRLGGTVGNTLFAVIASALGWTLGTLLPEKN